MLLHMGQHPHLEGFCGEDSKLAFDDLKQYTKALLDDNEKERNKRSIATRTRSGRLSGKKAKKETL